MFSSKSKRVFYVLGVVFIVSGLVLIYFKLFRGCDPWNCTPTRSFAVFDLELSEELFPDDVIVHRMHQPSDFFPAQEAGFMSMHWEFGGLATYSVERFGNTQKSKEIFQILARYYVQRDFYENPNIEFSGETVDEFRIGCGFLIGTDYRCGFDARYEEFTISLLATIGEEFTTNDFEDVLLFIDERMASLLEK